MPSIADIRSRALQALRPPPKLKLSEWPEANVRLPEGVSAMPGALRLWPYQREIADAITDPTIERVTLVKPVRVGFTCLLTGAVAAFVANDPCPVLVLLPTTDDTRDYVVSDGRAGGTLAMARERGTGRLVLRGRIYQMRYHHNGKRIEESTQTSDLAKAKPHAA